MFYFDPGDSRVLFGDIRHETHVLCDGRALTVAPDFLADYRKMPHADGSFRVVVFDPPHLTRVGKRGWMFKKYGGLDASTWREDLTAAFSECFRVLKDEGVLIFKWNETQIPVRDVLALTPEKPLVGHVRAGKSADTHWITFLKAGDA